MIFDKKHPSVTFKEAQQAYAEHTSHEPAPIQTPSQDVAIMQDPAPLIGTILGPEASAAALALELLTVIDKRRNEVFPTVIDLPKLKR